jgi:phosphate acyltransferase
MTDKPPSRCAPEAQQLHGRRAQARGRRAGRCFVSAGNTGAQMAASTVLLKLHAGLTRPAIGTIFPTATQPVLVLDSGANVDCSAQELVQFARIGAVVRARPARARHPAVGLLSIGEEAEKGNAVVKDAHQRLLNAGLNFIGNVEGRDIPRAPATAGRSMSSSATASPATCCSSSTRRSRRRSSGWWHARRSRPRASGRAMHELDADEYGGAPLLGVNGVSIISHGKSPQGHQERHPRRAARLRLGHDGAHPSASRIRVQRRRAAA